MSRKDQFKTNSNPSELTIEWAGDGREGGFFRFYDKERKENVPVKELTFAVLGERNAVGGWVEEKKSNAYSNEVSSLKNQTLTVKCFDQGKPREIVSGKYADIKDRLAGMGIKYQKIVYILVLDSDAIEPGVIAKIMLHGAASGAWMEFKDKQDGVRFAGFNEGKKGAVKFRTPKFEKTELDEAQNEEAEFAYEQVNAYFRNVPHTAQHDDERVPAEVIDASEDLVPADEDQIPF